MAEINDFDIAKADRAKDCSEVTPEQLLKVALRDLQRDGRKCTRAFLVVFYCDGDPATAPEQMETYRANMSRAEEVAYLCQAWDHAMSEWQSD